MNSTKFFQILLSSFAIFFVGCVSYESPTVRQKQGIMVVPAPTYGMPSAQPGYVAPVPTYDIYAKGTAWGTTVDNRPVELQRSSLNTAGPQGSTFKERLAADKASLAWSKQGLKAEDQHADHADRATKTSLKAEKTLREQDRKDAMMPVTIAGEWIEAVGDGAKAVAPIFKALKRR